MDVKRFWRRFYRQPLALFSLSCIVIMVTAAIAAPLLAPYSPFTMNPDQLLRPPSLEHWAGTDRFGRDVLSRLIYGARIALEVAATAVGLALVAGTMLGIAAGYWGGKLDWLLSRVIDVMLSLPEILLALTAIAVLGPSQTNLMIAIGVVYTPLFARIARGATLRIRSETYLEASLLLGASSWHTIWHHVLPNIAAPLTVQVSLSLAFAILAEASLSFLGFGVEPDIPSWGMMLQSGKNWMEQAWWLATFPGLIMTLAVLSFNLFGDQLRRALGPSQQ
jgi:peptide/nickel transport system permease protein